MKFFSLLCLCCLLLVTVSACDKIETEAKYPTGAQRDGVDANDIYSEKVGIFGGGGLLGAGKKKGGGDSIGIAVNTFLWRASLDTVSFMPLTSADPFGGTILTDWHSPEGASKERFKVNVFILTRELRSDGIRVRVFKQTMSKSGAWVDSKASEDTARQLEDTILTRARQLKVSQINQ